MTADTDIVVALSGVSKIYPLARGRGERIRAALGFGAKDAAEHVAVEDVTLAIRRGESLGILGVNGAGKSTLLQMIAGTLTPTRGTVDTRGRVSALLELGAGFNPAWTGRQNAEFQCRLSGIPAGGIAEKLTAIEAFADVGKFFDQPMKTYSSGMFVRVAFAASVITDPDLLIVDEALAVGDARFQNKCFRRIEEMKAKGATILLVTHSPEAVARFCSRAVLMDAGRIVADGAPPEVIKAYMARLYGGEGPVDAAYAREATEAAPMVAAEAPAPPGLDLAPILAAFHLGPNAARLEARPFHNPMENRIGDKGIEILDALLFMNGRPEWGYPQETGQLTIAMRVKAHRDIPKPNYGVILKTRDEFTAYGWNLAMEGAVAPPLKKGEEFIATVTVDLAVCGGDYFIDLAASEHAAPGEFTICDWRMAAIHVTAPYREHFFGLADLGARFAGAPLASGPAPGQ